MRVSCRSVLGGIGAFLRWTVAGALLGLAGGAIFGLLTGLLWVIFTGDLTRGVNNGCLFALAGAAAGLLVAVFAWWERPLPSEGAADHQTQIIVTRVPLDGHAARNGSEMEERWTPRSEEAPQSFRGETRRQGIE
jgi:hypothetical protein